MTLCNYDGCFEGKTVLVTGGAGFIGSHLTQQLIALGAHVRVLDNLSTGNIKNLAGLDIEFSEGSILDYALLSTLTNQCSNVFHLAAFVSVPESIQNPLLCYESNIEGTRRVMQAAGEHGCNRVIFSSSAACYGSHPSLPSEESDALEPASPYASSKRDAEQLLKTMVSPTCDSVSLRYFNVFGEGQSSRSHYAAVIAAFLFAIKNGGVPQLYGDGSQTRDFIHVSNVVHANLLAASHQKTLSGGVFNVGTGEAISILALLQNMTGKQNPHANFLPERDGDIKHSCADIQRITSILGFSLVNETETALKELVNPTQQSTRCHPSLDRK